MAQQFHEHKMDVIIKMDLLTRNKRKNLSMLMGDLLVFSVMGAAASEYLHMLLIDRLRIMGEIGLSNGPWLLVMYLF
jgi:hypothetical protein